MMPYEKYLPCGHCHMTYFKSGLQRISGLEAYFQNNKATAESETRNK